MQTYSPEHVYALQHLPYAALAQTVPAPVWTSYGKVCVVRNPWDRLVSDWHWRRKSGLPLGDLPFASFARFVVQLLQQPNWDTPAGTPPSVFAGQFLGHFKPQARAASLEPNP